MKQQTANAATIKIDEEIERLAALDPKAYEIERNNAATQLDWRISFLDAEVEKARQSDPDAHESEQAPIIEKLEPWPDPVNGASLAEELKEHLTSHVVFASEADVTCATLWVFGTYLMETWRLWPRLLITSPTKACGKSTLLEAIDTMAHRSFIVSNASTAAIFRIIEEWKPTLLLDEADTWMKQNEELAGVLNSGHTRRAARVLRVQEVNGKYEPTALSTWCPMVIASIGSQRDTLMSRSIIINLRRKLPQETVTRLPPNLHSQLLRVRRQLSRWAKDNAVAIGSLEDEPPTCGNDRMQDNFTPLWRMAAVIGGPWPERINGAYTKRARDQEEYEEPAAVMMLGDIADLFADRQTDHMASSELASSLELMEDREWATWQHGKPVSTNTIAKLMKPFGIKSKVKKLQGKSTRVYLRDQIEAAAARYTHTKRNPVTSQQNQGVRFCSIRNLEREVTPPEPSNPLKNKEGYAVTTETWEITDFDDGDGLNMNEKAGTVIAKEDWGEEI